MNQLDPLIYDPRRCLLCDGTGVIGAIERESAIKKNLIYEFSFLCPDTEHCLMARSLSETQKVPYTGSWKGYFKLTEWDDRKLQYYEPIFACDYRSEMIKKAQVAPDHEWLTSRKWLWYKNWNHDRLQRKYGFSK